MLAVMIEDDRTEEVLTVDQMRTRRWVMLVVWFIVIGVLFALAYGDWPGASGRTRDEAVVAFVSTIVVGVAVMIPLMAASVRSGRRGRRWSKPARSASMAVALGLTYQLQHASWQLVGLAVLGAVMIVLAVGWVVMMVMVSPEEAVRRLQQARVD